LFFTGEAFEGATGLVVTFVLKETPDAIAWEDGFVKFLKGYNHPNMTIIYSPDTLV